MFSSFGDLLKSLRKRKKISQEQLARKLGVHTNTISGWERGNNLPGSKGIVLELARHLYLDEQEVRQLLEASLTALSAYWYVPYQRNPFFTGRNHILRQLHNAFNHEQASVRSQSLTLSGLGGIGKTQTAIEYAYKYANDYSAIFWFSAETNESIVSSFVIIADLLNLPEKQEQQQQRIVAAVTRWLNTHSDWLLIFDNVENPALVKEILPTARHGCLLFTSRRQALGLAAQTLDMEQMTSEEGMRFLLHRARLLDPTLPLNHLSPTEKALAQEIVAVMDGLPLALDQAGAYIEATQCSLSHYIQLLQASHMRLLHERDVHADHPQSVVKTFSLIFEQLEKVNVAAVELLTVCSYLSPEAIPETFFFEGATHLGPTLEMLAADLFQFDAAIKTLLMYSLLHRNIVNKTVTMHRLVQAVLKGRLPEKIQRMWVARVIGAMTQLFPSEEIQTDYCQVCEQLLSHALTCITLSKQWNEDEAVRITLMCNVATYLLYRARYAEAEPLYIQALQIGEHTLGFEHPLTAKALHGLASLYFKQGKYGEAEPLYIRSLRIREQALGTEDPLVAMTLNKLADLYREQGKYEEAEPLFQRALRIREQALGPEHILVAYVLNNLALLYWQQGKYENAESLYIRVLCISEQALGLEHPELAHFLNNLAVLYVEQGKYEKSKPIFQRSLHIWEQALGPEHTLVAYPLHGLAEIYREQGRYEEAEPLFQRALHIREQALGTEHPLVTYPLTGLAGFYKEQGKYEEAEPLFQRALYIREQALGTEHPEVAYPLSGLAEIYREQGKYEEAESLFQRALRIREQALGTEHPEVAETLYQLACLYQIQQCITKALSLYRRSLILREQTLGSSHPKTIETKTAYSSLLRELEYIPLTDEEFRKN